MMLSGGGFRFGYYLGMHAAAVEAGQEPDLLLATCGGAVAGAIIAGLPDSAARKAWLASPEMYAFFCGLRSSPRAAPLRALANVMRRRLDGGKAARIPDLYHDYLFEIPAQLPLPAPRAAHTGAPALAILGGKLLFGPEQVGQMRRGRPIYAVTLFGDARTAALAHGLPSAVGAGWTDAVAPTLEVDTAMPRADAARISIADMFYFRCQTAGGADYTGGVVDLFPVELAFSLAEHVTMEMKQSYDQLMAIPALRAVFGIDGNHRLRRVHGHPVDVWVDTSDVSQALRGSGVQKRIDWRRNRIALAAPASYPRYVADVEAQWQYGYQRAQEAYTLAAQGGTFRMRNADQYNKALP
ncbi:patatin-like phospholipase family protein [Duganella aceris]|uniref:Patatin-like phospholipase family protein n=1 Tax=Duganella aceris TaxID=2703883 RepID=A0ABX0FJ56_9BURK|nr:patatin-like phospholipase family protein [Duganella aceris]NGZ84566.1 patatin-like phospholipase family protein [Duganella aceris]